MKYGDMLRDLRDPNTSQARLDEIYRLFNELGDREEKYKGWTQFASGDARLVRPTIGDPRWTGSPLNLCSALRLTDLSCNHNTDTYITFTDVRVFGDAFAVSEDKTKIYWNALNAKGFTIGGY